MLTSAQIIVLATPVFLALIAVEWVIGVRRGRNGYQLNDAINSISCGVLSQVSGALVRLLGVGAYTLVYQHAALLALPADAWWVWLGALVAYDFLYYWNHRLGHRVSLLWAAHVVHHQSEHYNLSTALRQTSTGWLFSWVFYLPMAIAGVPPVVFGAVALIDLLYQFWVHTEQVGKLGWFDRWFCSPSNHRVHHAVNDRYLDKNFGGILILWDRLFGTFVEEDDAERCVYGTRKPLRSWNPVWANVDTYAELLAVSAKAQKWPDKLRVWWMPPGWRPREFGSPPAFSLNDLPPYNPPVDRSSATYGVALMVATTGIALALLWQAHTLTAQQQLGGALIVVTGAWVIGKLFTPTTPTSSASP